MSIEKTFFGALTTGQCFYDIFGNKYIKIGDTKGRNIAVGVLRDAQTINAVTLEHTNYGSGQVMYCQCSEYVELRGEDEDE